MITADTAVRNALTAGMAAISVAVFVMFVRAQENKWVIREVQGLGVSALLGGPDRYDSLEVSRDLAKG